jgi:hypothetical protein
MSALLLRRDDGQHVQVCRPKTSSASCDQPIFVDQPADASLFSDAVLVEIDRVPLENSQQVLVAFGGHETCPRPVLGGLAWRVRWPRRGWRARVCCPAAVPRRVVLSLRVYRAVMLVSGPGSLRAGVHGRD